MSVAQDINTFFVLGGTLRRDAPSYIARPADEELLRLTLAGEYCNVLAARQMGKSSLMVRTVDRLRAHGVRAAIIDLTAIGTDITVDEWYFGLVTRLARQLRLVCAFGPFVCRPERNSLVLPGKPAPSSWNRGGTGRPTQMDLSLRDPGQTFGLAGYVCPP